MFLLDTDHLVIVQRDVQPEANRLRQRMARHSPADFYLSVVSVHEQMLGANKYIAQDCSDRANEIAQVLRKRLAVAVHQFLRSLMCAA